MPCMTDIALFDCHRQQHARSTDFVAPSRSHTGDAGSLQIFLQERRTYNCPETGIFVWQALRRETKQNWIVSVIYRFDIDHWIYPAFLRVGASPVTEGSLRFHAAGIDISFYDDFGVGGDR